MTCVWNRRRVSRQGAAGGGPGAVLPAAVALVVVLGLAHAAPAAPIPVLPPIPALLPTTQTTPARVESERRTAVIIGEGLTAGAVHEAAWLREDRAWLNGSGRAAAGALPEAVARLSSPAGGQPDPTALRRALWSAVVARGDTISALRGRAAVLRDRWLGRGYLQATVSESGDTLRVTPGVPWTLGVWQVGGDEFTGRSRLLGDWLPAAGDRFEPERIDRGARALLAAVGELGYPFPRWVISDLELDPREHVVTVRATLLPGTRAWIGPVTSDLEDPRAAAFLARASGLGRGAPIRGSDLRRATDRLWARDLYAAVDTPRVYATSAPDTVGVHFPARLRARANRLQIVLGLSRRNADEPARLSGEVDLRLPNLAASGRALRIGWRNDGAGRARFGFGWLEPLAFGTPLDATLSLDSEVQEEAYTRFTTELGARLPVVALWGVELGFGLDRSTFPAGAIARSERRRARAAILHRRGDRAISGWEGSFAVESAWRSAQEREGAAGAAALAAATQQRLLAGEAGGELWLGRRTALAGRLAVRRLSGGERQAPLAEQFRFGGAATVRGYGEGDFHGVEVGWASLEWRLGAPRGSRLYTFWDVGYFEFWTAPTAGEEVGERRRGWPRGYGLGLLAHTPGGDLSLAVGFPGTVDFGLAKLHVTLLESF